MNLLALETSTPTGSIAILEALQRGGEAPRLLHHATFHAGRSHSSQLFVALEEAFALIPPATIRTIAIGLGPGSYAGVRIALSAATGLSLAHGATLLGLPSVVALDGPEENGPYLALGDARRDSFYLARIENGQAVEGPELIPAADLATRLAAYPNLPRYTSDLSPELMAEHHVAQRYPDARRLAALALAEVGTRPGPILEPIYLREPHITRPASGAKHKF